MHNSYRISVVIFIWSLILSTNIFSQSASELVQAGFTNYQIGDYEAAIRNFNSALEKQNSDINKPPTGSTDKTYTSQSEQKEMNVNEKQYTRTSKRTYTDISQKQYVDTEMKKYVDGPLEYQGDEPAKIYLYRGWTYFKIGNKEAALNDFDKAVSLDPNLSEIYFRRALLNYDVDPDKACPNLLKAIERGHKSAKELYELICK